MNKLAQSIEKNLSENISSAWRRTTLGEIGEYINGRGFKKSEWSVKGLPIIRIQNLTGTGKDQNFYDGQVDERHVVNPGDLLISWAATLGAYLWNGPRAALNQHIFKVHSYIDKKFHYYLMQYVLADLWRQTHGSGMVHITKGKFDALPVVIPNELDEQKKIVSEIEKQFSRLDEAVANLKRVSINLKHYKATVLKAAVEGHLVETEAEIARREHRNYETGDQLLRHILETRRGLRKGNGKYREPLLPDAGELQDLPEGWIWATAEQLTDENRAITYGVIKLGPPVDDGISVLRSSDVRSLRIDLENVKKIASEIAGNYRRTFLRGGEVILTVRGTLGGVAVVPPQCSGFNVSREIAMLALVEPAMAELVALFIASAPIENWLLRRTKGIAYTGINIETLKALPVPVPPAAERSRITAEINRRLSLVRQGQAQVDVNLKRAERLRQAILERAFSWQFVNNEADSLEAVGRQVDVHRPNKHFARVLLSAEIVHKLHSEPTFGRIKHQKIFHLCEHIAGIDEIEGQYFREAAGPLDSKLMYSNEAELRKQKWYEVIARTEYGHAYVPMTKAGNHLKYVQRYWPDKQPTIDRLIELMRTWSTDQCEIFSTTYSAWNDLIISSKPVADDAIVDEILNHWHDAKRRFSESRWRAAISWIKREGYIPTGFGKATFRADEKLPRKAKKS